MKVLSLILVSIFASSEAVRIFGRMAGLQIARMARDGSDGTIKSQTSTPSPVTKNERRVMLTDREIKMLMDQSF